MRDTDWTVEDAKMDSLPFVSILFIELCSLIKAEYKSMLYK